MKYLFAVIALVLVGASVARMLTLPDMTSTVPVLYWVTDDNPARVEQVALFEKWLVKKGLVTPQGLPECELRVDTANADADKKVIQAVSGVGGDIMDTGTADLSYYHAVGFLHDVTNAAHRLGFDADHTWPAIVPSLFIDGRQYRFPCNVYVNMLWVNEATFAKYGLKPPPHRWTIDDFGRLGKELVDAANPPGQRRKVFFADGLSAGMLADTLGVSTYNETMTACALNDPRYIKALRLIYQWTYQDHLLPSAADKADFATQPGYAGATLQLFNAGRMAMFVMGRYALIQLREFNKTRKEEGQPLLQMEVVEPPYGQLPITRTGTRAAVVYQGGKHIPMAEEFLAYLASKDYNMQIVRDADALPPDPRYTQTQAFLRPPNHPEEWGLHEQFSRAARTIAVAYDISPFILPVTASRLIGQENDAFMNGMEDAPTAARHMALYVDQAIQRNLQENPSLKPAYAKLVKIQARIDALRRQGRPVPAAWITNPYYRFYYQRRGWLAESATTSAGSSTPRVCRR